MGYLSSSGRLGCGQWSSTVSRLGCARRAWPRSWTRAVQTHSAFPSTLPSQSETGPSFSPRLISRLYSITPGRFERAVNSPDGVGSEVENSRVAKSEANTSETTKSKARKSTAKKSTAKKSTAKRSTSKVGRKKLTEKQKEARSKRQAAEIKRDLRAKALFTSPKELPSTKWLVLFLERVSKGTTSTQTSKTLSAEYKSLGAEELERVNRIARENKLKNQAAYKQWLAQHSPLQILEANKARTALSRLARKKDGGSRKLKLIRDERLVKLPISFYSQYFRQRIASRDMADRKPGDALSAIAREYMALSEEEKKPYKELAAKDRLRYIDEYTATYGSAPALTRQKKKKKTAAH